MRQSDMQFFEVGLESVNKAGNIRVAVGNLVQLAAESANSAAGSFYLVDEEAQVLRPFMTFGLSQSYIDACGPVPIGEQCCGRAVQHRKPWIVSDMQTDPLFASAKKASLDSPIRAAFSVPVIDETGRCVGSLACHYAHPYTPTDDDLQRNAEWAKLIAHALQLYANQPEQTTSSAAP